MLTVVDATIATADRHCRQVLAAYTFDAGPNAVIFVQKQHHSLLTAFMLHFFPPPADLGAFTNRPDLLAAAKAAGAHFLKPQGAW